MKDEIKEILEQSLDYEFDLTFKQRKELLDYITNLQDTLKDREEYCYGLETQLTNLQEEVKFTEDYKDAYETTMIANKMLEEKYIDYKSRIDKAVEYIKKEIADIEWMKKEYSDYNKIGEIEVELKSIEKLNDILNGDDE